MRLMRFAVSGLMALTACGGAVDGGSPDSVTAPSDAGVTTTVVAETATTSSETTVAAPVISEEQLAVAAAVGDIAAGEALFSAPVDGVTHSVACVACHSLDGTNGRNPTIVGISTVAGDRVSGMSAIDYLRQSIVDPYAFTVEGDEWNSAAMPYQYPDLLSEAQIDSLVAFLLTQ